MSSFSSAAMLPDSSRGQTIAIDGGMTMKFLASMDARLPALENDASNLNGTAG
jgi:hypothetical protein